jgi:hypothetical protein
MKVLAIFNSQRNVLAQPRVLSSSVLVISVTNPWREIPPSEMGLRDDAGKSNEARWLIVIRGNQEAKLIQHAIEYTGLGQIQGSSSDVISVEKLSV